MPMPLMAMAGPPPREALRLGAPASMPVLRHKFPETWVYANQTAFVAYSLDTTISSSTLSHPSTLKSYWTQFVYL